MLPAALACALVALALGVLGTQRIQRSEQQMARRLQAAEATQRELAAQVKAAQDSARDVQTRNALLEAKVSESIGQQAQLEHLYRDIARNRDDWMVADVENTIGAAVQQLQLTGNVRAALLALEDADARLAGSAQPPLIGLRRVLARDIERLRALPAIDLTGQAIRLDAVIGSIDQLPMLAAARLAAPAPSQAEPPAAPDDSLRGRLARAGGAGWAAVLDELRELVRVRRVDDPDALLMAPEQAYFVRENLKLRLTAARTALLARQEAPYRGDLARAVAILERDFDARDRQVAGALALLRSLRDSAVRLELPVLTESLMAVRALRAREAQ